MLAKIKHSLLSFDKDEFVPIYREGKLDNLDDFIAYKAGIVGSHIVDKLDMAYWRIAQR